jgi:hypothetical protein
LIAAAAALRARLVVVVLFREALPSIGLSGDMGEESDEDNGATAAFLADRLM